MKRARATVRDVASAAGVSTATVSRALSAEDGRGSAPVSDDTRERVLAAAAKLDYRADHVARSLKTRSTRTIAVLAPELANDFFMALSEGMERELERSGYMLLVSSSANSPEQEKRRLRILSERLVDGIVVIPASRDGAHLHEVAARGTPVVLVDRTVDDCRLDAVLADNEGGAYAASRALFADGASSAVFVGGDAALSTARERLAGFERAAAEADSAVRSLPPRLGGMGIDDGYRHMDGLIASSRAGGAFPDALFAVNLLVHLGVERRLLEEADAAGASFKPPAIASFDETPYSPFLPACRYSVAQPAAEMGAAAARLALERVERRRSQSAAGAPRVLRLPTVLIRHPRG